MSGEVVLGDSEYAECMIGVWILKDEFFFKFSMNFIIHRYKRYTHGRAYISRIIASLLLKQKPPSLTITSQPLNNVIMNSVPKMTLKTIVY
jgi:hypothetical protein